MGSSLTGLDTSISSGREFWSSWPLDCSQPGGRVPVTEVMSGGARRRESQKTGGVDSRLKGGHSRRCTTFTIALRTGPKAPQHGLKRRNRPKPLPAAESPRNRLSEGCPPIPVARGKISPYMNAAMLERRTATEQISDVIERVTFHNDDSSFCVLRVKVRGQGDETIADL